MSRVPGLFQTPQYARVSSRGGARSSYVRASATDRQRL
ncbi:hypothetical protein [Streptomyces soliscabiei]|nr:hypothetical protein [Streptomyces sp. NY05-11A]MDX2680772.1 hypothetical protein [Streptomyces sp. NY05-11A]